MWRLLILVSVAPFILGALCANLFGFSVLMKKRELSLSVEQLIRKLLASMQREDIEVAYVKGPQWSHTLSGHFKISTHHRQSYQTTHAARAIVNLGLYLLHEQHQATVNWRLKTVKMGYLLPIFILLIVLFAFITAKLPLIIALTILSAALGGCTVMLWLSLGVEREAALLMVSRVEQLRILPRLRDEEDLVDAIRATPWASLIPGVFLKLFLRG